MYKLVEFTDDNEVAVVPDCWVLNETTAVWPIHVKTSGKLDVMVKQRVKPGETWESYPIRIMCSSGKSCGFFIAVD